MLEGDILRMEEGKAAESMRALRYKTHASSAALMIENVEKPIPGRNEILIQVIAFSINPMDVKVLTNPLNEIMMQLPHVPCRDFTGTVVDTSRVEDSRFMLGSIVWGMMPHPVSDGSAREFICVEEQYLSLAPRKEREMGQQRFDPVTLAGVPLVGLTVVESMEPYLNWLKSRGETAEGKRILIHGGSGGVGSFAVQYARNTLKMHVISTTGRGNFDFVKGLGAHEVVGYSDVRYSWFKNPLCFNMDVVLDPWSYRNRKITLDSEDILLPQGFYIDIASSPHRFSDVWKDPLNLCIPEAAAPNLIDAGFSAIWNWLQNWIQTINMRPRSRSYRGAFFVYPSGKHLRQVRNLIASGDVKVHTEHVFSFTPGECRAAFDHVEKGHTKGKVVVGIVP